MTEGYFPVSAYLRIDAVYDSWGEVVGAKIVGVTQKKPKHDRSVKVTFQIPVVAFEPLVLPTITLPYDIQLLQEGEDV